MQTRWLVDDGKWYYFNSSGQMQIGTVTIDGIEYNFNSSGQLETDSSNDEESNVIYEEELQALKAKRNRGTYWEEYNIAMIFIM